MHARRYLAILYRVPRMRIVVRGTPVRTKRASSLLASAMLETYTPHIRAEDRGGASWASTNESVDDSSATALIELGWSTDGRLNKMTESLYAAWHSPACMCMPACYLL